LKVFVGRRLGNPARPKTLVAHRAQESSADSVAESPPQVGIIAKVGFIHSTFFRLLIALPRNYRLLKIIQHLKPKVQEENKYF
jgi:hypothetical protein